MLQVSGPSPRTWQGVSPRNLLCIVLCSPPRISDCGRALAMAAKFEIYEDARGEFRFRLKAGNGEIVATGEGYATKDGAKKGVEAVKRAAAEAAIVEV